MWTIRALLLVLALGCADHAYGYPAGHQDDAGDSISRSLENIAATYHDETERSHRTPQAEPCGPDHYGANTDLCAQWKAADGAANSAWWAWLGGLLGFGSLFMTFGAVALTFNANRIARRTAETQLRAHIGITKVWVDTHGHVIFEIRNYGQTPAYAVDVYSWSDRATAKEYRHGFGIVDPGHKMPGDDPDIPIVVGLAGATETTLVNFRIEFSDAHGRKWKRYSAYRIDKGIKRGADGFAPLGFVSGSAREEEV